MNILETFYILFDSDAKKVGSEMEDARRAGAGLADELDHAADDAGRLNKNLDHAEGNAGRLGRTFKGVLGLVGALATLATATVIAGGINQVVEEADRLGDASARIRLSAQDFDTWRRAVKASGGELEDAEAALASYDEMLRRIQAGIGKRGVEALASLGLSATDAEGNLKDVRTSLLEVAGALEGMNRAQALAKIRRLGITDEGTIALLLKGRAAVEALTEEQLRNGAITEEQAKRINDYKDASEQLSGVLMGWKFALVSAIAPALTTVSNLLSGGARWLRENRGLVEGFGVAMAIVGGIVLATYVPAMWTAAAATLAATWPILLIIAAIAALVVAFALAYEDIKAFFNGQPSLIGTLYRRYKGFFDGIAGFFRGIYSIAAPIFGLLRDIVLALGLVWFRTVTRFWTTVASVFGRFLPYILPIFEVLKLGVQVIGGVFKATADNIWKWWGDLFDKIVGGVNKAVGAARSLLGLGQGQLAFAGGNRMGALTSNSISNGNRSRSSSTTIGSMTVNTQATDAKGIAGSIGGHLSGLLGNASAEFDDGVER